MDSSSKPQLIQRPRRGRPGTVHCRARVENREAGIAAETTGGPVPNLSQVARLRSN